MSWACYLIKRGKGGSARSPKKLGKLKIFFAPLKIFFGGRNRAGRGESFARRTEEDWQRVGDMTQLPNGPDFQILRKRGKVSRNDATGATHCFEPVLSTMR